MTISKFQGVADEVGFCRWKTNPIPTSMSWDKELILGEIFPKYLFFFIPFETSGHFSSIGILEDRGTRHYHTHIPGLTLTMSYDRPFSVSTHPSKRPIFFFSQDMIHKQTSCGRNEARNIKIGSQLLWPPLEFHSKSCLTRLPNPYLGVSVLGSNS